MEEKKDPRIPPWKVWILVLSVTQAVSAVQNFRSHQLLWDAILRHGQVAVEYIENQNRYLTEQLRLNAERGERRWQVK